MSDSKERYLLQLIASFSSKEDADAMQAQFAALPAPASQTARLTISTKVDADIVDALLVAMIRGAGTPPPSPS